MKTKKEIRKLQKNFQKKKYYLVLYNALANSTSYKNKIKVGEKVHFVRNANVNDDFVSPLLDSSLGNTKKGFIDFISKKPEVFRIFANGAGIEDVFTPADLVPFPTIEELKRNNRKNKEIIQSKNPYLARSSFLDMIKNNTNEYFKVSQGRVIAGEQFNNDIKLFHFTNAQHAIISSGEMRMSHYQYEDDKNEVMYTINLINEICESLGEPQCKVSELVEGIKKKVSQTYLLSLTSQLTKDMWNEYSSNDGACFQFDPVGLNSVMTNELQFGGNNKSSIYDPVNRNKFRVMTMNNIIYDQEKQKDLLNELVEDFLNEKVILNIKNSKNAMTLIGALYSLFFKDPKWKRQKEARFVAVQNSEILNPTGFQKTINYERVPYVSFKLFESKNGPTPITKIYVTNKGQKEQVQEELNVYTMSKIKVSTYEF